MNQAPFKIGETVTPDQLLTWNYAGLTGKPGVDKHALRRFTKGIWTVEVIAHKKRDLPTRVVSVRTVDEDQTYWSTTRQRLMRHRR